MTRQDRAEATRRAIIYAAVDVFADTGYGRASLNDIIGLAGVSKGALYFHFDSKVSLARGVIDEAHSRLSVDLVSIARSHAPALEKYMHGCFVAATLVHEDRLLRTGARLLRGVGDFQGADTHGLHDWIPATRAVVVTAVEQHDLCDDLDPDELASAIVSSVAGAFMVSDAISGHDDVVERLQQVWGLCIRAAVPADLQGYFREFLAREVGSAHARLRLDQQRGSESVAIKASGVEVGRSDTTVSCD